jgi:hypothetical protein
LGSERSVSRGTPPSGSAGQSLFKGLDHAAQAIALDQAADLRAGDDDEVVPLRLTETPSLTSSRSSSLRGKV